ncbi:MAG: CoA transferase [Alphaproteobacteria bacterium]|nr:CoA transferase [Alphaproteobacteria bacterium]
MTDGAIPAELPLAGFKVIELGHSVAAPYGGLILAEMGAEVIKVERPGAGDDCRAWGPPFKDGMPAVFRALNRNKKSIQVDLKSPEGIETIKALAKDADAVLQNLKPGLVDKIGIGPEVLCAANERLIYCSIHAFGKVGPLSSKPGYDPLMQAFGGIMSTQGEQGRPSVRTGTSMIDMGTGMWAAMAILSGLLRRERTGRGGVVDTSLYETALGWMTYFLPTYTMSGKLPAKSGSGVAMISPYQAMKTKDSELVMAAGNDNLFAKLCQVLGHPEWIKDPRFLTNGDRVVNKPQIIELIESVTTTQTTDYWIAQLEKAGIPNAPVQTIDEVAAHPQTAALDILREDEEGIAAFFGLPISYDGKRPNRNEPPPALGAHDDDVAKMVKRG